LFNELECDVWKRRVDQSLNRGCLNINYWKNKALQSEQRFLKEIDD